MRKKKMVNDFFFQNNFILGVKMDFKNFSLFFFFKIKKGADQIFDFKIQYLFS